MSNLLPLPPPVAAVSSPPPPSSYNLTNIGLGYALAIALGFLLIFTALLLCSYICCRRRQLRRPSTAASTAGESGVIVPRVIFVAEDDEDGANDIGNPERLNSAAGIVGLDQSIINSYPKFEFWKSNAANGDSDSATCSICLCDYREREMLRMMPDCKHSFHLLCLDAWLRLNGSCPVCRSSPLPTPLSTPLAEVVPLALFADNRRRRS